MRLESSPYLIFERIFKFILDSFNSLREIVALFLKSLSDYAPCISPKFKAELPPDLKVDAHNIDL